MLEKRQPGTYGQIYAPSRSTCGRAATWLSAEIALDLTGSTEWIFPSLMTTVCNPSSKVELAGSTTCALVKTTPFGADSSHGLIANFDSLHQDHVISETDTRHGRLKVGKNLQRVSGLVRSWIRALSLQCAVVAHVGQLGITRSSAHMF